jgi:hypothetical protein
MTIQNLKRQIIIDCDDVRCTETFHSDEGEDFQDMWQRAKECGWVARRVGKDWLHFCAEHDE